MWKINAIKLIFNDDFWDSERKDGNEHITKHLPEKLFLDNGLGLFEKEERFILAVALVGEIEPILGLTGDLGDSLEGSLVPSKLDSLILSPNTALIPLRGSSLASLPLSKGLFIFNEFLCSDLSAVNSSCSPEIKFAPPATVELLRF